MAEPAVDLTLRLEGLEVPHLDQYFGVWAIVEDVFRSAVERIGSLDLAAHIRAHQEPAAVAAASARVSADVPVIDGGIALVSISGPMMKYASSMSAGASTVAARRQLRQAADNPDVAAILLRIDSPGGTVAGTQDLAADVAAAAKKKPVMAYAEDLMASAAYWVGSQAHKIFANPTALVGSIGTYMVVYEQAGAAAMQGVKAHVIRAGEFKGMGTPGTEITAQHLAELQRITNDLNEHFLRGVAGGRGFTLTRTRELADGRVHVAAQAQELGLVDGVQSFEATIDSLRKLTSRSPKGRTMSQETANSPAPRAELLTAVEFTAGHASYQDLVAAFPKASKDFICDQLAKKATLDEARAAYTAELEGRLASQGKELEASRARETRPGAPALTTRAPGAKPGAAVAGFEGDPVRAMSDAVREQMKLTGQSRLEATATVCKSNPDLHRAYLEATNPGKKARSLIAERFDGDE